MAVVILAADKGLIDFDNAAKLIVSDSTSAARIGGTCNGRFCRAEAHPHDLKGANALLAGQHQVRDPEPVTQRLVRVLEDGAGQCEKR